MRAKEVGANIIIYGIIVGTKHSLKQVIKDSVILWGHITSRKVADIGHYQRICIP